MQLLFVEHLNI